VFVRLAGKGIVTAEESPPHAPLDGVDNLHLPRINGLPPRLSCHGMHLQSRTAYFTKSPNILSKPDRKENSLGVPFRRFFVSFSSFFVIPLSSSVSRYCWQRVTRQESSGSWDT
jgi:hypothetical protein